MFGFGRRSKAMPRLGNGLKWWVIESAYRKRETGATFRIFRAVVAQNEQEARANLHAFEAKLDTSRMRAAIRRGEIADEYDWEPASALVADLSVSSVATQADVATLDPALLAMLREHHFFLDEFRDDPQFAVGGGVYDMSAS